MAVRAVPRYTREGKVIYGAPGSKVPEGAKEYKEIQYRDPESGRVSTGYLPESDIRQGLKRRVITEGTGKDRKVTVIHEEKTPTQPIMEKQRGALAKRTKAKESLEQPVQAYTSPRMERESQARQTISEGEQRIGPTRKRAFIQEYGPKYAHADLWREQTKRWQDPEFQKEITGIKMRMGYEHAKEQAREMGPISGRLEAYKIGRQQRASEVIHDRELYGSFGKDVQERLVRYGYGLTAFPATPAVAAIEYYKPISARSAQPQAIKRAQVAQLRTIEMAGKGVLMGMGYAYAGKYAVTHFGPRTMGILGSTAVKYPATYAGSILYSRGKAYTSAFIHRRPMTQTWGHAVGEGIGLGTTILAAGGAYKLATGHRPVIGPIKSYHQAQALQAQRILARTGPESMSGQLYYKTKTVQFTQHKTLLRQESIGHITHKGGRTDPIYGGTERTGLAGETIRQTVLRPKIYVATGKSATVTRSITATPTRGLRDVTVGMIGGKQYTIRTEAAPGSPYYTQITFYGQKPIWTARGPIRPIQWTEPVKTQYSHPMSKVGSYFQKIKTTTYQHIPKIGTKTRMTTARQEIISFQQMHPRQTVIKEVSPEGVPMVKRFVGKTKYIPSPMAPPLKGTQQIIRGIERQTVHGSTKVFEMYKGISHPKVTYIKDIIYPRELPTPGPITMGERWMLLKTSRAADAARGIIGSKKAELLPPGQIGKIETQYIDVSKVIPAKISPPLTYTSTLPIQKVSRSFIYPIIGDIKSGVTKEQIGRVDPISVTLPKSLISERAETMQQSIMQTTKGPSIIPALQMQQLIGTTQISTPLTDVTPLIDVMPITEPVIKIPTVTITPEMPGGPIPPPTPPTTPTQPGIPGAFGFMPFGWSGIPSFGAGDEPKPRRKPKVGKPVQMYAPSLEALLFDIRAPRFRFKMPKVWTGLELRPKLEG